MALHPHFPVDPYAPLPPDERWFPAAEVLRATAYEKLLPPLVAKIREEIKVWRDAGYKGATATSQARLTWWFDTEHLIEQVDGRLAESGPAYSFVYVDQEDFVQHAPRDFAGLVAAFREFQAA